MSYCDNENCRRLTVAEEKLAAAEAEIARLEEVEDAVLGPCGIHPLEDRIALLERRNAELLRGECVEERCNAALERERIHVARLVGALGQIDRLDGRRADLNTARYIARCALEDDEHARPRR